MTDYTSTIAGNYQGRGPIVKCILNEGAPTYKGVTHMPDGTTVKTATFASPLEEGMVVGIENDDACLYAECEGMPVVRRCANTEVLAIGQIVSTPKLQRFPSETDADDNTLDERIAGKYYRTALVEFHVGIKIVQATVMADGSNATVPGVATTLNHNLTSSYVTGARGYYFDSGAANGVGCIPLHYVPAGSNGDTYSCAVLLTGLLYTVTGA